MRTIRITTICILIIAVFGLSAFAGHAAPLHAPVNPGTTNLEAWWSLDETSGTRNDSHGANHLTDNNTVSYDTGVKSNAAYFIRANSEQLTITDNASLSTGNIDFTTGCWLKLNSASTQQGIFQKGAYGSGTMEFHLQILATNLLQFSTTSSGTTSAIVNISNGATSSTNTWIFVTTWHTNATIHIQVNNGTIYSNNSANSPVDRSGEFRLGMFSTSSGNHYLNGYLDECFFYKRILTADEREWLYNSGSGRTYADLTDPATSTPTETPVNTATFTPSPTFTFTPTNTFTPTFTATFTNTATNTNTPVHTATFTDTPTATDTPTDTPTPTETFTPTITFTPTNTFTPSPTRTPGNMATAFYDGTITYGDTAQVVVLSLLCLVVTIAFLAWLITTNLQKRRRK